MTVFWILAALATALAGLLVLTGARRGATGSAPSEAPGRELAELDRLQARGLIDAPAHAAARAEAARRLLSAPSEAEPVARPSDRLWVLGALAAAALIAAALYGATGRPGLADQPFERRVDDWSTRLETLDAPQLAAVAARMAEARPDDPMALKMLGAARFEAGDPIGAASAFRRALALTPDDGQSWARLGESLVRANQGAVGADAEAAFREALTRDPGQLGARYFLGEAALARGETGRVRELWSPLIAALDPADPRRIDLERRLPAGAAG
jgi:cytochrome c-type biogenesis protein CcmH